MNRRSGNSDPAGAGASTPAPRELASLAGADPVDVARLVADTGWGRDLARGVRVLVFQAAAQIVVLEIQARVHWMALDGVIRPCPAEPAAVRTRRVSRPPARVDAAGRFQVPSVPAGPLSLVIERAVGADAILVTEWVSVSRDVPAAP